MYIYVYFFEIEGWVDYVWLIFSVIYGIGFLEMVILICVLFGRYRFLKVIICDFSIVMFKYVKDL